MTSKELPVSEVFTSVQGEGVWSGQLQTFIRLAGCTVGKPYPKEMHQPRKEIVYHERDSSSDYERTVPGLPIYTEQCTLYDGRHFACDTDYRVKERLTPEEIVKRVPDNIEHVCITGGEPLMHDLTDLIDLLSDRGVVHIETSGSKEAPYLKSDVWVTVSPKHGILDTMLTRADELKFLVDKDFNPEKQLEVYPSNKKFSIIYLAEEKPCFLQPINDEWHVRPENLQLCIEWQRKYTNFRLSLQGHKVMSDILKEVVR